MLRFKSRRVGVMSSNFGNAVAGAFLAVVWSSAAAGPVTTYDMNAQFSYTTNPNGVWTYGETTGIDFVGGGTFTKFTLPLDPPFDPSQVRGWMGDNSISQEPAIFHNITSVEQCFWTVCLPANITAIHPGGSNLGRDTTVRFTAPVAGTYSVSADFWNADVAPSGVYVGVFLNHVLQSTWDVISTYDRTGTSPGYSFARYFNLNGGDYVDFLVDNAGPFYSDSTGLRVVITTDADIPEPATLALLALGLAGVGFSRRKRT